VRAGRSRCEVISLQSFILCGANGTAGRAQRRCISGRVQQPWGDVCNTVQWLMMGGITLRKRNRCPSLACRCVSSGTPKFCKRGIVAERLFLDVTLALNSTCATKAKGDSRAKRRFGFNVLKQHTYDSTSCAFRLQRLPQWRL